MAATKDVPALRPTETFEMNLSDQFPQTLLAIGDRIHAEWLPDAEIRFTSSDQAIALLPRLQPQLVVVDLPAWSPGLADALQQQPDSRSVVLVADASEVDAVGGLLHHPIAGFLDPAGDRFAGRQLLEALLHRHQQPDGVADFGLGSEFPDPLELLRRDAERVARALGDLAASRPADAPAPRPITASRIRQHIKARRLRDRFFGPDLFADPAWDMLLDLAAARLEQRPVSVSSLCIAAAVPTTTGLRWIKTMLDRGLFVRRADPSDARRAFIELGEDAAFTVEGCLDAMLNLPGQ